MTGETEKQSRGLRKEERIGKKRKEKKRHMYPKKQSIGEGRGESREENEGERRGYDRKKRRKKGKMKTFTLGPGHRPTASL